MIDERFAYSFDKGCLLRKVYGFGQFSDRFSHSNCILFFSLDIYYGFQCFELLADLACNDLRRTISAFLQRANCGESKRIDQPSVFGDKSSGFSILFIYLPCSVPRSLFITCQFMHCAIFIIIVAASEVLIA